MSLEDGTTRNEYVIYMRDWIWRTTLDEVEKKYKDNLKIDCQNAGVDGVNELLQEFAFGGVVKEEDDPEKAHNISFGIEDMDFLTPYDGHASSK